MYYENFEKLCKKHNTNPSQVSRATGISTATFTSWKKDIYTPKNDKLQKIADHFGVSIGYLMGTESEEPNAHLLYHTTAFFNIPKIKKRRSFYAKRKKITLW